MKFKQLTIIMAKHRRHRRHIRKKKNKTKRRRHHVKKSKHRNTQTGGFILNPLKPTIHRMNVLLDKINSIIQVPPAVVPSKKQ